jgi:hypothetical protein
MTIEIQVFLLTTKHEGKTVKEKEYLLAAESEKFIIYCY